MARKRRIAKSLATITAGILLLTACADAAPEVTPTQETTTPTLAPILPHGDGELVLGTLLPLSGEQQADGLSMLAAIELAIRDVNVVAGQEYLGGIETQPNLAYGQTIARYIRSNTQSVFEREQYLGYLDAMVAAEADLIIGPQHLSEASQLLASAREQGLPLYVQNARPTTLSNRFSELILVDGLDNQRLMNHFYQLSQTEQVERLAYVFLPDEQGNQGKRILTALDTEQQPASTAEASAQTSTVEPVPSFMPYPIIFAEQTAEQLASQVSQYRPDLIGIAVPNTDAAYLGNLIVELVDAGFQSEQIVLLGISPVQARNALQQQLADQANGETPDEEQPVDPTEFVVETVAITGVRAILNNSVIPNEFHARVQQVDPWQQTVTLQGQWAYDAVIKIALARAIAEDDNGQRIGVAFERVTGGAADCYSYAECLHVLSSRDDINYRGVAAYFAKLRGESYHDLQLVQIRQDNSLTVLN